MFKHWRSDLVDLALAIVGLHILCPAPMPMLRTIAGVALLRLVPVWRSR